MSIPHTFNPLGVSDGYPEGTLVWFDPSGETQVAANVSTLINANFFLQGCPGLTYWDLDFPKATNFLHCFYTCTSLEQVSMSIPKCTTLDQCFYGCTKLHTLELRDCNLVTNIGSAFASCSALKVVVADFPKATEGSRAFFACTSLTHFKSNLDSLTTGTLMFGSWTGWASQPLVFDSALPKLSAGTEMFLNRKLDSASVKRILTSIPSYTDGTHALHIGARTNWQDDEEIAQMLGSTTPIDGGTYRCYEINEDGSVGDDKGWTVTVQSS